MAGNVREWVHNRVGDRHLIMGGSYLDQQYQSIEPDQRSGLDRSAANGIRCMQLLSDEPVPELAYAPVERNTRDYRLEEPVSDEVFQAYLSHYAYDRFPLEAELEVVDDTNPNWRKEKITYAAAYDGERAIAYLWVPKNTPGPHQTVILYPGSTDFLMETSEEMSRYGTILEFFPLAGRAVLYPIYKGTYERRGLVTWSEPNTSTNFRDYVIKWVQDASRGIDYLETREDIDAGNVAFFGYSWGGEMAPIVTAVETRIKASVIAVGGLPLARALPEADAINFAPRVTIPTLMLEGRDDFIFPHETSQLPLYALLGSPDEQKEMIAYDGLSHDIWPTRRNEMIRETLRWLDQYLGPVSN